MSQGSKVTGSWESLGPCWELNSSPLNKQLITNETLQSQVMLLFFSKFKTSPSQVNNGMYIVSIIGRKCQQTFSSYYLSSIFKRTFQSNIWWSIHFPLLLWHKVFTAKYKRFPKQCQLESQNCNYSVQNEATHVLLSFRWADLEKTGDPDRLLVVLYVQLYLKWETFLIMASTGPDWQKLQAKLKSIEPSSAHFANWTIIANP